MGSHEAFWLAREIASQWILIPNWLPRFMNERLGIRRPLKRLQAWGGCRSYVDKYDDKIFLPRSTGFKLALAIS